MTARVAVKAKVGRPSKYRPEFADQGFRLALLGHTDEELAKFFDVDEASIKRWYVNYPEFRASIKRGKEEADTDVAERLYRRAMGYSHEAVKIFQYEGAPLIVPYTERYPPETAAAIFWLKNRQRLKWRDKQDIEHSGAIDIGLAERIEAARKRKDR